MGLGNIGQYMDENLSQVRPIDDDSFQHFDMPIEENKQLVAPAKKVVFNWKKALTRELMRGKHTQEILRKYHDFFVKYGVLDKAVAFLNQNDGLIGYFVVDVSVFDDKFGYGDIPQFMRSCNLYAINSTELQEIMDTMLSSQNDGTLDGFLCTSEKPERVVRYVDVATGLPVVENAEQCACNDNDERLQKIADLFLKKKMLGLGDYARFKGVNGKLPYLVNCVKASLAPKSNATGKHENLVADYGVKEQEAIAVSAKAQKAQEVVGVSELKVDDIGNTSMPEKMHVSRKRNAMDFVEDVNIQKKQSSINVAMNELKLDNIAIGKKQTSAIGDDLHEASRKDRNADVRISRKQSASINEDEFFALDATDDEIEFDAKPDEIEVSASSEWNF